MSSSPFCETRSNLADFSMTADRRLRRESKQGEEIYTLRWKAIERVLAWHRGRFSGASDCVTCQSCANGQSWKARTLLMSWSNVTKKARKQFAVTLNASEQRQDRFSFPMSSLSPGV